jgi:branched-chain amino acid aminotransferase
MALEELASVDGEIAPTGQTMIPVCDDGLYRGDGVFEVVRLYSGRPFALVEHLDRLERSAAAIELTVERGALEAEVAALLERAGAGDGQVRILLTRAGRRIALTEELPPRGETISLASVTYSPSVILTGVKSLSYGANMQATRIAAARDADEAVLVRPDGIVLEAPTASIFWVSAEGPLRTPALSTGILASITRSKVINELHVEEGEFELDDLLGATEAFLASTTREVQAVSAIDGRELEAPGPRTLEAADGFARRLDDELDARAPA